MPLFRGILRAGAIALLLAVTAVAGTGCDSNAPTLPIPPPGFLTAPDSEGYATLSGTGATPDAMFFAFNEDAETGVISVTDADGAYSVRVQAETGDTITYWVRRGVDESPPQSSTVPAP